MSGIRTNNPGADDFGAFLDSLRNRFDGDSGADDVLVLLDDEPTGAAEGRSGSGADGTDSITEPELPLELAPPMPSWRRLAAELAVGFGAMIALEVLLGRGVGSPGLAPHPYWLVVLPIAAARGFAAGMVAALLATLLILLGSVAQLEAGRAISLLSFEHGVQPLALLLGGFVVGQIADGTAARHRELWRRMVHQSEEFARSAGATRRLLRSNRELQVRLLDHRAQFGHLLDAARRLESATREDLYAVALDMIGEHCAAERCSVVTFADDEPVVLAARGWATDEGTLLEGLRRDPAALRAWRVGERFDAFRAGRAQARGPLLITPLTDDRGRPHALLCLDAIPGDRYHQGLASVFFGIGDWTQTGIDRLRRGDRVEVVPTDVASVLAGGNLVGSTTALRLRLFREQGRVDRGDPVSLLTIRTTGRGAWTQRDLDRLDKLLDATVLNGVIRESDGIYRLPTPGTWLAVLPHTPQVYAPVVVQQLAGFLEPLRFGRVAGFAVRVVEAGAIPLAVAAEAQAIAAARASGAPVPESGASLVPPAEPGITCTDAGELALRIRVEGALAQRRATPLFAVLVACDPEWIAPHRAEAAIEGSLVERVDALVSLHRLGPGRFVLLLPEADPAETFRLASELVARLSAEFSAAPAEAIARHVRATTGGAAERAALLRGLIDEWAPIASPDAAPIERYSNVEVGS